MRDWVATYEDPIQLAAGDRVELTGRQDHWDGHLWLWAKSTKGLEGWIPDDLVLSENGIHRAREEYTAVELTCLTGQLLTSGKETHGWVYCYSADGQAGWVPKRNLVLTVE